MIAKPISGFPGQRRILFHLLGIPWTVTNRSAQFVASRLVVGIIVALIFAPAEGLISGIGIGLLYGLLLMVIQVSHIIGHTIGGRIAGAPMSENLIMRDYICTLYHEAPGTVSRRVELTRTLAGPLMNITLGLVFMALSLIFGGHILRYIAVMNLLLAFIVLMPIPSLDGEILWRRAAA